MIVEKGKKLKADPIKTIGLNATPIAREIVIQIAIALGLRVRHDQDDEGNIIGVSAYAGNCLRLSDHCTYMQTWVDAGTWNAPYRFDIVIEDDTTIARQQVKEGYDFNITEFVTKAETMDVEKAKMIAYDIRNTIKTGQYANNIRAEKRLLQSNHGSDSQEQQNEITNESRTPKNMKRNTIKLNESTLRQIVAESVKKVLRESFEGTDEIDEAVTNAASIIADTYYQQNGGQNVVDDHDDSWYELQEKLRESMLQSAFRVVQTECGI